VFDLFVDTMIKEFEKQQAKVERADTKIEVGGAQASGVGLRTVLDGELGNAEAYSLVLGRRLVMVSFIGSDKELDAAASAWAIVRNTLKVGEMTKTVYHTERVDTSKPATMPNNLKDTMNTDEERAQ
jgi:hypothetical protein